MNILLTSGFGSSTRGEGTILKSLSYHIMQTTSFNGRNQTVCPNVRNSTIGFRGPTSKSQLQLYGRTPTSQHDGLDNQLFLTMVGAQLQLCAIEADIPTVCLHRPKSTPNWLFFKIFKFSGSSYLGMMSFTLQPHFLSGVYYDNFDCHILCAWA